MPEIYTLYIENNRELNMGFNPKRERGGGGWTFSGVESPRVDANYAPTRAWQKVTRG